MGLKDFFNKISSNNSLDYVVDKNTLKDYVNKTIKFAKEHELEIVSEFYLFNNGNQQLIQIWNLDADQFKTTKGISIKYNGMEYTNFDGFFEGVIQPIEAEYVHIRLTLNRDEFLDEYKKNHPELKPQDF